MKREKIILRIMNIDQEEFNKIKKNAESFYKKIGEVYCPYFKDVVGFNAKGLDHIKFKEWNKARPVSEQYMRLKLIRYAPDILKKSHTLQGFAKMKNFERQKINSRWEKKMVDVKYYAFIAVKRGVRIKIVVKEIQGSKRIFWSIIPFWKQKKSLFNGKTKKILYDGDLETQ